MRITDKEDIKRFEWNRCVGPHGNLGGVDPQVAADLCDRWGIPWYSTSWPYSGGISAYCLDDKIWNRIIKMAKS